MPDSDYPVRCEFWGDEITDLSYFDIETQRRFKKADKITLSPSTEIVIEDRAALADKIEHKAKLLRSKNSAKAKENFFRGRAYSQRCNDCQCGQIYQSDLR